MQKITPLERVRELLASRRLHWVLTIFVGILVVFYFLFVTFFFNPFEDELGDMASVVPREAEYFFRWKGAGEDFDDFPIPSIWADFESSDLYGELDSAGVLSQWDQGYGVAAAVQNLQQATKNLPPGLSFEKDLLREVAMAGRGTPSLNARFDGMIMLRVSFKVKAGVALLGLDSVRSKLPQSLQIQPLEDGRYRLPQFAPFGYQDAYLTRIQDVLLLASRPEWLDTADSLLLQSGQDSLAQASVFRDQVEAYLAPGDQPVEVFLRWEKLKNGLGRWPDPAANGLVDRVGRSMFDTDLLRHAAGYVRGGEFFQVRLGGATDLSSATPSQRSFLQSPPMTAQRLKKYAGMVPSDSFLFVGLGGDPGKSMLEAASVLEPDLRVILDETVSNTGQYKGLSHLIEEIGHAAAPGMALALHSDDYPSDPRDVEHDDAPMPLFAIFAKVKDRPAFTRVMNFFRTHWKRFTGNDGRDRLQMVDLHGGTSAISFASPLIPGTGEVLVLEIPAMDTVVVCNSFKYAHRIVETAFIQERDRSASSRKLSLSKSFSRALESHKNGASAFIWFDPQFADHWLKETSLEVAREAFRQEMSKVWASSRPAETKRLRDQMFPGKSRLTRSEDSALVEAVDEALAEKYRSREQQRLPILQQQAQATTLSFKALDWFSLGFRPNRREVSIVADGALTF